MNHVTCARRSSHCRSAHHSDAERQKHAQRSCPRSFHVPSSFLESHLLSQARSWASLKEDHMSRYSSTCQPVITCIQISCSHVRCKNRTPGCLGMLLHVVPATESSRLAIPADPSSASTSTEQPAAMSALQPPEYLMPPHYTSAPRSARPVFQVDTYLQVQTTEST